MAFRDWKCSPWDSSVASCTLKEFKGVSLRLLIPNSWQIQVFGERFTAKFMAKSHLKMSCYWTHPWLSSSSTASPFLNGEPWSFLFSCNPVRPPWTSCIVKVYLKTKVDVRIYVNVKSESQTRLEKIFLSKSKVSIFQLLQGIVWTVPWCSGRCAWHHCPWAGPAPWTEDLGGSTSGKGGNLGVTWSSCCRLSLS